GKQMCSNHDYIREQILSLGDTAYILMNQTVTLVFESPCFKKKYDIMFHSNEWYDQITWKNILKVEFTAHGIVINTENEIEYSENDLMKVNSEMMKDADCLRRRDMTIRIFGEEINGLFMGICDLDFEKKRVDLCTIYDSIYKHSPSRIRYQLKHENALLSKTEDEIVIKPIRTTIIIKTKYCNEKEHITEFRPRDFLNNIYVVDGWFRFGYKAVRKIFSSSISISISGIPIDYWNYNDPLCDDEPEFTIIGVNDAKRVCNYYTESYIPVYKPETRVIDFPYIIIIMLMILGKAICGYGIYKRRQARLVAFTTRRIVGHIENVSPGRNNIIIVSSNRQSESQSYSQRQPSEDLPPAYNDLQQTDSNPPGYEDACKSKSASPPGYEDACRDNQGFEVETETMSSNGIPESVRGNQGSTNDGNIVSTDLI
ncbi:unnamed protein product, partial [Meganyctiphanes norvegica]